MKRETSSTVRPRRRGQTLMPRRAFIRTAAAGTAGLLILKDSRSVRGAPANEKLDVALVGVGGRGRWFVDTMPKLANVVAMCDVNDQRAGDAYQRVPQARKFYDFRKMLEEMDNRMDGVIIATPDNTHAVIAAMAMKMGKHVYCEKPLTRDIFEARFLRDTANAEKVATQLGNQGTASEAFRRGVALIQAGVIGQVREVHAWNDSGGAGDRKLPQDAQAVPDHLKWDLWLGPAERRPYHPEWLKWHTWRDFATGQLGNWAVHTMNLAFKALKLDAFWQPNAFPERERPGDKLVRVQAEVSGIHDETFPRWEIVRYDFPARGDMPPVRIHWHNGRSSSKARERIEDLLGRKLDWGDAGEGKWRDHAGILLIGSKGKIHANGHNTVLSLLPENEFKDVAEPPRKMPKSPGHEMEWIQACKGGPPAMSNFNYGAPLTEFVLLGNIATLLEGPLEFDPLTMKFANSTAANKLIRRDYRDGWSL